MAEYLDDEGRKMSIDERWFMEWVDLGFRLIRTRLDAEDRMDEIDKRKQEGGE